jgi:hypothetical protein
MIRKKDKNISLNHSYSTLYWRSYNCNKAKKIDFKKQSICIRKELKLYLLAKQHDCAENFKGSQKKLVDSS